MKRVLILIARAVLIFCVQQFTPILNISQGQLLGLETKGGTYRKYLGLPYGTIYARFDNPGPPPNWLGILNSTRYTTSCPRYHERLRLPIGDENCLTLNVFCPGHNSEKRLFPVLVFMNGDSNEAITNSNYVYNQNLFVSKGSVVVTVNYRLGAFGFLCLRINGALGNAGLKDQVAALRWVQSNIRVFGGNPDQVTVFGESDGTSSVSHLILSESAKDLFHRAILQSNSALSPLAFSNDHIARASFVASKLGYHTRNPFELLDVFLNATKNDIVLASLDASLSNYIFRPCAEKQLPGSKAFITKSPKQIIESGNYNKVPIISGYNDKEALIYVSKFKYNINWLSNSNDFIFVSTLLPENLFFKNNDARTKALEDIKSFYFVNEGSGQTLKDNLIDYLSDILFHYPSVILSELFLKNENLSIFNYYFKYDSLRNLVKIIKGLYNEHGATHGDDLFYLFQPVVLWPKPSTPTDVRLMEMLTSMWVNFAKFGDPTRTKSSLMPIKWDPSRNESMKFMIIDNELKMSTLPNPERISFWKRIYHEYGV